MGKSRRIAAVFCLVACACGGGSSGGGGNPPPPPPPPGVTTLNFSTYLGSNGAFDYVRDVAVDSAGNVYAAGGTRSTDLPTTAGTAQPGFGGYEDAFVVKFNPSGAIVWSTYLGGAELDRAYALELDAQGNAVIAGRAGASFPVTPGALQTQFQGGGIVPGAFPQPQDGFVAKLRGTDGTLVWATFFGATDDHSNIVRDIAIDRPTGFIYLAASTDSGTFTQPILDALQRGHQRNRSGGMDGVLAKLSADGTQMPWATYVGGSAQEDPTPSVRVDSQGNPAILFSLASTNAPTTLGAFDRTPGGGIRDFYLAKYALDGPMLWATYLGGDDQEVSETHNLGIRSDGSLVVAGGSRSTNFPTTAGAYDRSHNGNDPVGNNNYPGDCVISIISASGDALLGGTFYGGRVGESCEGVGVDGNDNIYATGGTSSDDLPTFSSPYQTTLPANLSAFLVVFNRDLSRLRYGSYLGGSGDSIGRTLVVHSEGHFVAGGQAEAGFPLRNAARSNVSAGVPHGFCSDVTVPLGPG